MKKLLIFLCYIIFSANILVASQLGIDITNSDTYTAETNVNKVLKPNGAYGVEWGEVVGGTGSVATTLGDLTDVVLDGLGTNDVLYYDGTNWVPIEIIEATVGTNAGGGATTLGELTDVVLDGLTTNSMLYYDGTNWIPIEVVEAIAGTNNNITSIPLNGSSTLDWGVLNGTMSRSTINGYSTIYGDNDIFRYTDSLPIYSAAGGSVSTNYFACWRDTNATVSILQQVSTNNGSTWDAVTNAISATTNATVFGLSEITLGTGANLYRVAVATNATSGTIYIYQIDARGQW